MSDPTYDLVVIGGGSAGYAAARTACSLGAKTAVVDGASVLGGLCILKGCMPTKAILHAAELRQAMRNAGDWGIHAESVQVDLASLMAKKGSLIGDFAGYRQKQLEDGRFTLHRSSARFQSRTSAILSNGEVLHSKHWILATGSEIVPPAISGLNEVGCLTSDSALLLTRLPDSMVVLGGGAVALEFAQFFLRLGVQVSLVQRGPHVLRDADPDAARELENALRREGMRIFTNTRLDRVEKTPAGKTVHFSVDGHSNQLTATEIFHGLGRQPATSRLGLETIGVATEGRRILADSSQRTSVGNIYAAGDCCGPHEIVHLAVTQGENAARNALGVLPPRTLDDRLLLSVVFTEPQVAMVGLTEKAAAKSGKHVHVASYPFNDHGKSMILGCQEGFVKLLADASTGEIVGGTCVGPQGGELIHEVAVAMAARMTAAQFAAVPHYHPTLAEIWTYPAEELMEKHPH